MARSRSESSRGQVTRIGSGRRGHLDGFARDAELNRPFGVCALRDGLLVFTDSHNNAVRFVIPESTRRRLHVKTVESSGLLTPKGIAASADERHLFVCDTGHHKIKFAALPSRSALADVDEVTDGVEMFSFAGSGKKGWRDGPALEASFNSPSGVCEYADGTIIVADTGNHCIRQIRRGVNGKLVAKTIAGAYASLEARRISGPVQRIGCGGTAIADKRASGYRDGERSLFRSPSAIIAGPTGELLVADTMNNCIRGLIPPSNGTSAWRVSTVCGQTTPGHADGNCESALFDQPVSLCWGEDNNTFFVSDRGNTCIRQVGRSYRDGLSYTWPTEDGDAGGHMIVCDGGANVIKMFPLEELTQQPLNVSERFDSPKLLETTSIRSTFPRSGSESRSSEESVASLSPRTNYTDSEDLGEENQLGNDCEACPCEASRALEEALRANAALQAENLRLRELLQCTFDEIELADKRFSENYQPQFDDSCKLSPAQQSKLVLPSE
ncbi:hypothetical protein PF010_g14927 [Phytophthora fragariae]|uniref:SMP-30/Gluconolactonase/LRE-like region domain-containing protein n=1 Tax=Phytophthora fragariae TaxID=53985 RepID=A0A6A3K5R6_9STRA|nr:hypothetical protein PF011_g14368 [Phytophthora fragariae]KAE9100126.1 hypothetical protein PF010_g14927 [Phytophthora fragariae]KAE9216768.1 hypothetical protein PF004_g14368 [Phytophthora fragariae]KAE9332760.1 hypothetical protein PF008_g14792 [Phytophthora fragariae]